MIPKYRAWHKDKKLMLNVIAINFELLQITADIENKKIYPDLDYWWKETDIPFSEIELMQSTGLFDKNGVEIFEGDIVNIHWFYFDGGGESEVQLHCKEILNYKGVLCFEWQYDYCPLALGNWHEESFEVVGNIYENQEFDEVEDE